MCGSKRLTQQPFTENLLKYRWLPELQLHRMIFESNIMDAVIFERALNVAKKTLSYLLSGIRVVHEQPIVELEAVT